MSTEQRSRGTFSYADKAGRSWCDSNLQADHAANAIMSIAPILSIDEPPGVILSSSASILLMLVGLTLLPLAVLVVIAILLLDLIIKSFAKANVWSIVPYALRVFQRRKGSPFFLCGLKQ